MGEILRLLFLPIFRLLLPLLLPKGVDPWERRDLSTEGFAPRTRIFPNADYFRSYLRRPSSVAVDSLEEICAWLRECRCDEHAYTGTKTWQRPNNFEATRRGVCFDHALWGWRKLIELGVPSLLVWGQYRDQETSKLWSAGHHLWVQFCFEGVEYLFETTTKKDWPSMIWKLSEVRGLYRPWYAVDSDLRRYEYQGIFHWIMEDLPSIWAGRAT